MVYKFRSGNYKGLDAQVTGDELERIRQGNDGRLESRMVWAEAKKKSSPLHNAFTWDKEKAAESYWTWEAQHLIRAVVQVEGETERSAFINVSVRGGDTETEGELVARYYQAVHLIASNPIEYESALAASRGRLSSAQQSLDELLGLASRKAKTVVKRAQRHVQSAVQELTA